MTITLTRRQQQVGELVARGLTAREIGRALGMKPATANQHIRAAAERIGGETTPRHRLTVWFLLGEQRSNA
jgi:DNA-binding CsgD family transcriptional regulator